MEQLSEIQSDLQVTRDSSVDFAQQVTSLSEYVQCTLQYKCYSIDVCQIGRLTRKAADECGRKLHDVILQYETALETS